MQELNLSVILSRARQGWRTPVLFAIALALFSVLTLIGSKPQYKVVMTVVPAPADQGGGQSALPTSGALSSLLGIAGGGNVNFLRYQKLLSSTVVAQRLQDKYDMLHVVFRNYWDPERHIWVPRYTMRDYLTGWLLRLSNVPTFSPPDATALAKYLEGALTILPTQSSDIVSITMETPDVDYAKRIMLEAHEQANQVLRDQVIRRARLQVGYLEGKLNQTPVEDYRATLLIILGNQQKTLMLAQTDASYAAEILSPPVASPTPIAPRPVLTLFVAVLVGLLSGFAVVIFVGPQWWHSPWNRLRGLRKDFSGAFDQRI
jgi:uncharacterized protein involved in exopolysaccharide biosynthesis